jgi:hypothetical protein
MGALFEEDGRFIGALSGGVFKGRSALPLRSEHPTGRDISLKVAIEEIANTNLNRQLLRLLPCLAE